METTWWVTQDSDLELYSILRSPSCWLRTSSVKRMRGPISREVSRAPGTASTRSIRSEPAGLHKLHFVAGRGSLLGGAVIAARFGGGALVGVLLCRWALGVTVVRVRLTHFLGGDFWRTRHLLFRTGQLQRQKHHKLRRNTT